MEKKNWIFFDSRKNLNKRLEDSVYNLKKKNQKYKFSYDDNDLESSETLYKIPEPANKNESKNILEYVEEYNN